MKRPQSHKAHQNRLLQPDCVRYRGFLFQQRAAAKVGVGARFGRAQQDRLTQVAAGDFAVFADYRVVQHGRTFAAYLGARTDEGSRPHEAGSRVQHGARADSRHIELLVEVGLPRIHNHHAALPQGGQSGL